MASILEPRNIKIFIIIFNILLTSLQEQTYLWKVVLIQRKQVYEI